MRLGSARKLVGLSFATLIDGTETFARWGRTPAH
jgi:hypothetical protein